MNTRLVGDAKRYSRSRSTGWDPCGWENGILGVVKPTIFHASRPTSATVLLAVWLLCTALPALAGGSAPASAGSDGDGHDHVERATTAPSFNESAGCDSPSGIRGPYVRAPGVQDNSEPLYGPWGDYFGRDIGEVRSRLVRMNLPMMDRPKDLLVHEIVAPALQQVIDNLNAAAAQGKHYTIRADHTFSYNPRTIGGRRSLSFHAIGAAIDVNSTTNPYRGDNTLITDMPGWFVKAWTDAGFCWGGDFQSIKDAMHFSWRGPMFTPGYDPTPPPVPPRTQIDTHDEIAASYEPIFSSPVAGDLHFFEDADRDGAPDLVRIRPLDASGRVLIEAGRAHQDFETCRFSLVSAAGVAAPGRTVLFADGDRDGRPDLWSIEDSGPSVVVAIYSYGSGYQERVARLVTGVEPGADVDYLVGDRDRDGHADLYIVHRTPNREPLRLEVWSGASGFTNRMDDVAVRLNANTTRSRWQFALGDRDLDGVPDLYAFNQAHPVRVRVFAGATGYAGAPASYRSGVGTTGLRQLTVGDYDGDGRDDLYALRDDGSFDVYLGGKRGGGADLSYWFRDPEPWEAGGCRPDVGLPTVAAVADVTGDGAEEVAALYQRPGQQRYRLEVRDRVTGDEVTSTLLTAGKVAMAATPFDAPTAPALAVLSKDAATGLAEISVWRADTGALLARFEPAGDQSPVDVGAGHDASGDAMLALLEYSTQPMATRVRTFTTAGAVLNTISFGNLVPVALQMVPDFDGDATPELAVVGSSPGRDAPVVKVRSGATGALLASIKLKSRLAPVALVQLPSFAGGSAAELAILAEDPAKRRTHVIVTDGERKQILMNRIEAADSRPVGLTAVEDFGGDPSFEVAVVVRNDAAGRTLLRVYDASSGLRLRTIKLVEDAEPIGVAAGSDRSGNGIAEALLPRLVSGSNEIEVMERDAGTGKKLGTHTFT